jgi:hypothetical protein
MDVIFYFNFGQTNANFSSEICYNLVHFRNLHRRVPFKADILSTKQSMNLTLVFFYK